MNWENNLANKLEPLRKQLLQHPLYTQLDNQQHLQAFMEIHAYAVWDFMSLVKALQQALTCTKTPWIPVQSSTTCRLINEIVLGEESDIDQRGQPKSHFELYVEAMEAMGAKTKTLDRFIAEVKGGKTPMAAAQHANIPLSALDFMNFTFDVIENGNLCEIAGVFAFGREDLIPEMFIEIVRKMNSSMNEQTGPLLYYLERHIEVDGDEHGPMAAQMIRELCGDDMEKWHKTTIAAQKALEHRLKLWDSILQKIEEHRTLVI